MKVYYNPFVGVGGVPSKIFSLYVNILKIRGYNLVKTDKSALLLAQLHTKV